MPVITHISQLDPSKTYTYADYLTWKFPERTELLGGKVHLVSPITWRVHQTISGNLTVAIGNARRALRIEAYVAPFDVRLPHTDSRADERILTVVQPDISVFRDEQKLDELGGIGSPDWIIEILAPETIHHISRTKFEVYEASGVAELWLITPGLQSVLTYVLKAGRYELHGTYYEPDPIPCATLPGFAVEWAEVFAGV